jgi:hypothetical protein
MRFRAAAEDGDDHEDSSMAVGAVREVDGRPRLDPRPPTRKIHPRRPPHMSEHPAQAQGPLALLPGRGCGVGLTLRPSAGPAALGSL